MKTASQTFDFKRYVNCIKRDIALNGRSWLQKILLMLATMTILLTFVTGLDLHDGRLTVYNYAGTISLMLRVCMILFGAYGASLFMENMSSRGKRLNELMSPASTLEKYLSRWTLCILGLTIALFLCFALAELLSITYLRWSNGDIVGLRYLNIFEVMADEAERWYMPWCALIGTQATFMLGSTLWPKNSFVKTIGILFGFYLVTLLSCMVAANLCLPGGNQNYQLKPFNYDLDWIDPFVLSALGSLTWATFCYVISYFRMRESEIINRP